MSKMKIILATRDIIYGSASQLKGILKELDKDKSIKKIVVIAPNKVDGYSSKVQFEIMRPFGKYFFTKEPSYNNQLRKKLKEILSKEKYDLINTHFPFKPLENSKVPVITSFHALHYEMRNSIEGITISNTISKILQFPYEYFDREAIKGSKLVLFESQRTKKVAEKRYPNYKKKFMFFPNFITTKRFSEIKDKKVLRQTYKLDPKEKYVLYVGRIENVQKKVDELAKAIDYLNKKNRTKLKLLLAGKGNLVKKLEKMPFVKYLGMIPNDKINEIYNLADLFVSPSRWECMATTLLESSASSTLTISTDAGDAKYVLDDKRLIIDNFNYVSIANAIEKTLALSENTKKNIIKKNTKRMQDIFDIDKVSPKIVRLFKHVAQKKTDSKKQQRTNNKK